MRNFPLTRLAELQDRNSQFQFVKAQNFQWQKQRRDGTPLTWPYAANILKDAGSTYWNDNQLRTFDYRVKGPTFAYTKPPTDGNGSEIKFVVYNKLTNAIAVVQMEMWSASGTKSTAIWANKTLSLWAGFNFTKVKNGDVLPYHGGVCITEALSIQPVGPNKAASLVIVIPAKLPPVPSLNHIPETNKAETVESWPEQSVREWRDESGQFKVQATFLDFHKGKVKLKTEDREISVELPKLSRKDVDFVRDLLKQRGQH